MGGYLWRRTRQKIARRMQSEEKEGSSICRQPKSSLGFAVHFLKLSISSKYVTRTARLTYDLDILEGKQSKKR